MEQNRFRPYNKSLFVNILMSNEYKFICSKILIPKHDEINKKDDNKNSTPLIWTCANSFTNITRLLLHHPKIDINIQNKYGYTALMCAVHKERKNIIKILFQNKDVNVNIQNNLGANALNIAHSISMWNTDIENLLIKLLDNLKNTIQSE